ncbi:nuclear lim interactor-interacting factor-like protein [Strigomonas culicis]|uniref:Nuclear lim interactor-interacting factor-like protein n=1 Tax=Strigomonas culicis TaxID=28005 RepID=S9VU72_9TRYP|nr:nuclear lim interactor-interacting factor-like protein [Strigomonas culicis]|eukprot:EPY26805.1 nuclear lim interactor-interacting factor-like protein [Strigomonas culicis]
MKGRTDGPTTSGAFAFFANYRVQAENATRACNPPTQDNRLITQVTEAVSAVDSLQSFIPVDPTKGTPSSRLLLLQSSPINTSPNILNTRSFLPPPVLSRRERITLVLDVDETLLHSTETPKSECRYDAHFEVEHESTVHRVYVKFRPYLLEFLDLVCTRFEVVIFTASVSSYCNCVMDIIDPRGKLGSLRLFREHCTKRNGSYIKDLFLLGRELSKIVIIDNSPTAYLFQQRNAIPIKTWTGDENDTELLKLFFLLGKLECCQSVYDILDEYNAYGPQR